MSFATIMNSLAAEIVNSVLSQGRLACCKSGFGLTSALLTLGTLAGATCPAQSMPLQNLILSRTSPQPARKLTGTIVTPTCPGELQPLVTRMLADLPSYTNRVYLRAGLKQNYLILADRPDFNPLPLNPLQSSPSSENNPTQQVFFTTLERMWIRNQPVQVQQFHWLFLSPGGGGWQLATIYSMTGSYPAQGTASPPRESSAESVGQAIQDWLRDCRGGFLPGTFKAR